MDETRSMRYRIDDLEVDVGARRVTRAGTELGITALTFDLLLALGRDAPNFVSFDVLMERVWPRQDVGTETLAQRVKILRRQLGDEVDQPRYVDTRRGHGYRLRAAMVVMPDGIAQGGAAFDLYQQARTMMRGTSASRDDALRRLDEALRLDGALAPARAHRAVLVAGSVPLSGEPRERLSEAQQDARRALEADPRLAEAHVALGMVEADRHRWAIAEDHFRSALALEPANTIVVNLHAMSVLRPTGRVRAALAAHEACHRRQPADGFTLHELTLTHSILGDDAEALRFHKLSQAVSGIRAPPWDVRLAQARAASRAGRQGSAARLATDALPPALRDGAGAAVLSSIHAALAGKAGRETAVRRFEEFAPRLLADGVDCRTRAYFLTLLAALGAITEAYDLLDRTMFGAVGHHLSVELGDLWVPEMRRFRADPRFPFLLSRLGISEPSDPV